MSDSHSAFDAPPVLIGLGNRFRGDDAIGLLAKDQVARQLPHCRVIEGCDDAMSIVSAWESAPLAVVVDAAMQGDAPGQICRFDVGIRALPKTLARCSSHGTGIAEALALSETLEMTPLRLIVYTAEVVSLDLGAELSPPVAAALPDLVERVCCELNAAPSVAGVC